MKGTRRKAKLTSLEVEGIRAAYKSGTLQGDLARNYGVIQSTISKIIRGVIWKEPYQCQK